MCLTVFKSYFRYKTLWGIIMKPLDAVRPEIKMNTVRYPVQIFGDDQSQLKPIKTAVVNCVETIAGMLLENDMVGDKLQNFAFTYAKEFNEDRQQIYGNLTSANWFRRTEAAVKAEWGEDVHLLAVNLSTDKTQVDRLRGISIWPCYVTIMNLTGKIRRTHLGSECVGYCPLLPYSQTAMETLLKDLFDVRTDHNNCRKLIERFIILLCTLTFFISGFNVY